MASLMETLIDILDKETVEYEKLLDLTLSKTPVIVSENLDDLARITDDEQLELSRIQSLDKEMQAAIQKVKKEILQAAKG